MELGCYSFGDLAPGARGPQAMRQRLAEVVALAERADRGGLDVFGLGEHHRPDYALSAPEVALGAIAARTRDIKLTTAVTILSSADPVRLFQAFATLDLMSGGRAELMVGRGAFVESFPLFGCALNDYDALFDEKLALLLRIAADEPVDWRGKFRPPLIQARIEPRPLSSAGKLWIGAGGTPQSAIRAGSLGLPLNLALIGGAPARFARFIDLYREAGAAAGHPPEALRVAVSGHLHVATESQAARERYFPFYARYLAHSLPQEGWPISRGDFEALAAPEGALFVGSPQEIIDKLGRYRELFAMDRFLAHIDIGGQPHDMAAEAIDLMANEIAPALRPEKQQATPRKYDEAT